MLLTNILRHLFSEIIWQERKLSIQQKVRTPVLPPSALLCAARAAPQPQTQLRLWCCLPSVLSGLWEIWHFKISHGK